MLEFLRKPSSRDSVEVTVSNRTIVRILVLVIISYLIFMAVRKAEHALILIFTAFLLCLALNSPVHWLASHLPGKLRGSRPMATAISFLVVVIILGTLLASIVPPLARQTATFIQQAPHLVRNLQGQNSNIANFIQRYHLQNEISTFSSQLSQRLQHSSGSAVSDVAHLLSSAFSVFAILALTFMMLIEGPAWADRLKQLLPDHHRRHAGSLFEDMYSVIRGYINGQVLLAAIAAALITPALFVFHIKFPLALAMIIFICGLIPMVGHTIGAIIVSIVALFHSLPAALFILAYYILYQQIETYVIQPRIQSSTTNLTPLLVFASVIIGVSFSGLFGGLVAIPVAGCLRVLVIDFLHSRGLLLNEAATQPPAPLNTQKQSATASTK